MNVPYKLFYYAANLCITIPNENLQVIRYNYKWPTLIINAYKCF